MKFKVGDKVKIVDEVKNHALETPFGTVIINKNSYPWLKKWLGKVVTIDTAHDGYYTTLEIKGYYLSDEMIEGLGEEETKPKDMGEVSDGYHTFNELYEYRLLYNAAFFNELARRGVCDVHKSKRHSDGEIPFGDPNWFIVTAELPTGQISNHYEMKDWDLFHIPEKELANKWDGHSPRDVARRLRNYVLE